MIAFGISFIQLFGSQVGDETCIHQPLSRLDLSTPAIPLKEPVVLEHLFLEPKIDPIYFSTHYIKPLGLSHTENEIARLPKIYDFDKDFQTSYSVEDEELVVYLQFYDSPLTLTLLEKQEKLAIADSFANQENQQHRQTLVHWEGFFQESLSILSSASTKQILQSFMKTPQILGMKSLIPEPQTYIILSSLLFFCWKIRRKNFKTR